MKDCPPVGELFSPRVDGGEAGVQVLGQQSGQGVAGGVSGYHHLVCHVCHVCQVASGCVTVRGCKGVVRRRGDAKRPAGLSLHLSLSDQQSLHTGLEEEGGRLQLISTRME